MKPHRVVAQEKYIRTREDPFFNDLLRCNSLSVRTTTVRNQDSALKIPRSTSDIVQTGHETFDGLHVTDDKSMDSVYEDSVSDIVLEPFAPAGSTFSRNINTASISLPSTNQLPGSSFFSDIGVGDALSSDLIKESSSPQNLIRSLNQNGTFIKSYTTNRTQPSLSKIPLPQSAASFYNGFSPQLEIVESCEGITRLNSYLKARKDEVSAGVPGRFLHVALGQDICDVGSLASTILYAFNLHIVQENELFCTVPVINVKRADLHTHAEIKWLLSSCQIDLSSLIFIDEIDLSYYFLFGSLKLVLINGHKLPTKQEALKDAIVEIFNCTKGESVYPSIETVTVAQDCSCCTVVAEKFAQTSPQILAGKHFSRLLLAGILSDTGNLTNTNCTSKDKYMTTLLMNGAGRFGCNGLYQILRYLMYDISDLKVVDMLGKEFKKWTRAGKQDTVASRSHVGMSSIGISIQELLAHEDDSTLQIKHFQKLEKVRLLMIVSGYYDSEKNFKREILVSAESTQLMSNLLTFLNSNVSELSLKDLDQPGLKEQMKAFEVDNLTSRKTIERLLEEFGGTSKTRRISLTRD